MINPHPDLVAAIRALPQAKHIPEIRIKTWISKLLLADDKPIQFHIDRLNGIGGSESASILAHYHDSASAARLEDGFKTADHLSREKLLLAYPFSTPYAQRGTMIEPIIRDIFCRKHNLFDNVDVEAEASARVHANNPYMKGNVDNVFFKDKRILVDFKSASKSSYQEKVPFSHVSQVNQYAENMRSNGYAPDLCVTANLVAEESVFADIIDSYKNREQNPSDYEFWVNAILGEKLTAVKLITKVVPTSLEFGGLINRTIKRFMEEYPLEGKTISGAKEKTVLIGDEARRAARIEAKSFAIATAEKSLNKIKEEIKEEIGALEKEIGADFEWPNQFPVMIQNGKKIDHQAALTAIELSGLETERLYVPSSEGSIDVNKLVEKFKAMGGIIDESVYSVKLDEDRLLQSIKDIGLAVDDFVTATASQVKFSRKHAHLDQKEAFNFEIQDALSELISEKAEQELLQIEDLAALDHKTDSMSIV